MAANDTSNIGCFWPDHATGVEVCRECRAAGVEHQVVELPAGVTDRRSCWGPGVPRTVGRPHLSIPP